MGSQYGKKKIVNSGDAVYWIYWETGLPDVKQACVEIILKIDDNIIGYVVIKIKRKGKTQSYSAKILKSSLIPKIDGEYQKVTEKQIRNAIKRVKR